MTGCTPEIYGAMEWHQWLIGSGGAVAAGRIVWSVVRRTHPLKPSIPLLDRAYGVATSSTLLLFCRIGRRQDQRVILDLITIMEQAGIALEEIREYRRRYESGSAGGTGSPFDYWIEGGTGSTNRSPSTPASSPSSDPTAPAKSKKNP
jgi:hypothetical protein